MPFDGVPSWIIASPDEHILQRYSDTQSVLCRRAWRPGFSLQPIREAVDYLANDRRADGVCTLQILNGFEPIIQVVNGNVIVVPPCSRNNEQVSIYNRLAATQKRDLNTFSDIFGRTEHSPECLRWLATDVEQLFSRTAPIVFSGNTVFSSIFHTITEHQMYVHTDEAMHINYGPRCTRAVSIDDATFVERRDGEPPYYQAPVDCGIEFMPGDITRLADPHGGPFIPKAYIPEYRLMIGIDRL